MLDQSTNTAEWEEVRATQAEIKVKVHLCSLILLPYYFLDYLILAGKNPGFFPKMDYNAGKNVLNEMKLFIAVCSSVGTKD